MQKFENNENLFVYFVEHEISILFGMSGRSGIHFHFTVALII